MSALSDALKNAKRPQRTVPVCLRGDLIGEIEQLNVELVQHRSRAQSTLASQGDDRKIAERIAALQEEMRGATVDFHLQGLSRPEWNQLVADHPPTEDQRAEGYVYDVDVLPENLVRRCLIDPVPTDDEWANVLAKITSGQFEGLVEVAMALSRTKVVDVPFSPAASAILQSSDET